MGLWGRRDSCTPNVGAAVVLPHAPSTDEGNSRCHNSLRDGAVPRVLSSQRGTRCRDSSSPSLVTESAALQPHNPLPHPSPSAIFKELDEGGVLLSTTDEVYFGVNPVGARIWSLLPPVSRTFGELCTALEQQYPDAGADRIRMDAQEFIEALIASGLVVTAPN